jgi:hypothetical protein
MVMRKSWHSWVAMASFILHAGDSIALEHSHLEGVKQLLHLTEAEVDSVWDKQIQCYVDTSGLERHRVDLVMSPKRSDSGFCTASVERYFIPPRSCVSSPCVPAFEKVVIQKVLLAESMGVDCQATAIADYALMDGIEASEVPWVLAQIQSGVEQRTSGFLCAVGRNIVSIKRLEFPDGETFLVGLESDDRTRFELSLARSHTGGATAECFEVL